MKVNETEPKCDFCGKFPPTQTLNDGIWWVCENCYADVMDHLDDCMIQAASRGEEE